MSALMSSQTHIRAASVLLQASSAIVVCYRRPSTRRPHSVLLSLKASPTPTPTPARLYSTQLTRRTYASRPPAYTPKARIRPLPKPAAAPTSALLPKRAQISCVPFAHDPVTARTFLERRAPTHAIYNSFYWSIRYQVGRLLGGRLDWFKNPPVELLDFEAVYVPGWRVHSHVRVPFTKRGTGDVKQVLVAVTNGYFPGTSVVPYTQLSFTPTVLSLPSSLPPFTPPALSQHRQQIRALDFDLSPLALPTLMRSAPSVSVAGHVVSDPSQVKWESLDASAVYFPFYVAKYRFRDVEFELLMEASQAKLLNCPYTVFNTSNSAPRARATLRRWIPSLVSYYQTSTAPSGNQPALLPDPFAATSDSALKTALEGKKKWITGSSKWHVGMGASSVINQRFEAWWDGPAAREAVRRLSVGDAEVDEGLERKGPVGRIVDW